MSGYNSPRDFLPAGGTLAQKKKEETGNCDLCGKRLAKETNVHVLCEDCLSSYKMCKKCRKEECPECGGRLKPEKDAKL